MDDDDDNPYNTAPSSSSSSSSNKKKAQKQALKASFQNPTTFKTPANGVGGGEGYFLDDEEELPDPVFDNAHSLTHYRTLASSHNEIEIMMMMEQR